MQPPQFRDAATRRTLLREAALRDARAAEAARILAAPPMYEDPLLGTMGLSSMEYPHLVQQRAYHPGLLAPPSLPLGLRGPSLSGGILPTAAIHPGGLPSVSSAFTRERALQTIAHEEAMLVASREEARRKLLHEEAILAASRERTLRNLAHEEALLAASREQRLRSIAREEMLLAATRDQAMLASARRGPPPGSNAVFQQSKLEKGLKLAATLEPTRQEIIHDAVEEKAIFEGRKLRSGSFAESEEVYANVLIDLFDKGLVDAEEGSSLRSFLAKALHCSPMRVAKKISGKSKETQVYIGRKYLPVSHPDYQLYTRKFQAAKDFFLTAVNKEWEREKFDADLAASGGSNGRSMNKVDEKLWKHRVQQLADYFREFGIGNLPVQNKYRELRDFVHRVRTQYKKKQLSQEKIAQLDEIGFIWSFRVHVPFEKRLSELRAFQQRFGHCRVPLRYKDNPSLGLWASNIRARYSRLKNGKGTPSEILILPRQIAALNALGFEWEYTRTAAITKPVRSAAVLAYQAQNQGVFAHQQTQRLLAQNMHIMPPRIQEPEEEVTSRKKLDASFFDQLQVKAEANLRALDQLYKEEESRGTALYGHALYAPPAPPATKKSSPAIETPPTTTNNRSEQMDSSSDDESFDEFPNIEEDISDDEYHIVVANLKKLDRLYQEEAAAGDADKSLAPQEPSACEPLSDDDFSDDEYRHVKKKLKKLYRKKYQEEESAPAVTNEEKSPPPSIDSPAITPKHREEDYSSDEEHEEESTPRAADEEKSHTEDKDESSDDEGEWM